jgi:hypothetical protein
MYTESEKIELLRGLEARITRGNSPAREVKLPSFLHLHAKPALGEEVFRLSSKLIGLLRVCAHERKVVAVA